VREMPVPVPPPRESFLATGDAERDRVMYEAEAKGRCGGSRGRLSISASIGWVEPAWEWMEFAKEELRERLCVGGERWAALYGVSGE